LISDLIVAVAFLTRLPAGRRFAFGAKEVARSARWFPLVGALLGGVYTAVLWLLSRIFPPLVTAIVLVALDAWLTGAMHLDGLADTADGFGGGSTREDVLRIMRDHSIGSYGAVALILVIAIKIATLAALIDAGRAMSAVVLAPVMGRWSAVMLGATQNYARPVEDDAPHSVGSPARYIGRAELTIATVTAVAVAVASHRWRGPVACVLVAFAGACWAWRCRRRIGGVTGDTLGAGIEMSECLVLLFFTALR